MSLMCGVGSERYGMRLTAAVLIGLVLVVSMSISAESSLTQEAKIQNKNQKVETNHMEVLTPKIRSGYKHVWPDMELSWKIVLASLVGFFGAACGSVGGVGGGGIYNLLLTIIMGFDGMITGAATATVFYNLKQRHPTLEQPLIEYNLALLFQPMMVLGTSIGVALNVIFADWMITILIIILYLAMATKTFLKGVETWKKESMIIKEAIKVQSEVNDTGGQVAEFECEPESLNNPTSKVPKKSEVLILENINWKELGLLVAVWVIILALQIAKNYTTTCSVLYWFPVAGGVSVYVAVVLYKGRRNITSKGDTADTKWTVNHLVFYCFCGVMAGVVGGLPGLGGGIILGPLFLEMGIPLQVSTATTTFATAFSASISVLEYYLLKRFPVPYGLYFFGVTTIAALVGQHLVRKLMDILGRASIIIFFLSFAIFVSALSLGGVGIAKMMERIQHQEYMGFDDICSYMA